MSVRPTSGVRPSDTRRTGCLVATPIASHAGTGSALPFRVSGSSSWYWIPWLVARKVRSPTVTLPGFAADWRRAATFTVSPITV